MVVQRNEGATDTNEKYIASLYTPEASSTEALVAFSDAMLSEFSSSRGMHIFKNLKHEKVKVLNEQIKGEMEENLMYAILVL